MSSISENRGKTMNELIAEQVVKQSLDGALAGTASPDAQEDRVCAMTIELTTAQYDRIETGLPDVVRHLRDAREIFAFFDDLLAQDALDSEHPGFGAVLRQAVRSLDYFEETHVAALEQLDRALRS